MDAGGGAAGRDRAAARALVVGGRETIFSWRGGKLEARLADAPPEREPSVFEPEGDDRFRVVSGRERGEALRVVRDDEGEVVKLYWATYPFTRTPEIFGPPS